MSATALRYDDWWLIQIVPTQLHKTREVRNDAGDLLEQEFYSCKEYRMVLKRKVVGVTAFTEDVDTTQTAFVYRTGPQTQVAYTSSAKKWVCVEHPLLITDPLTGEAEETQVWFYKSSWVLESSTKFTAS